MGSDIGAALQRLDAGSLNDIFEDSPNRVEQPVVQCVQLKAIAGQDGNPDRVRVVFNDSRNYCQTMLASSANEEYSSGRLKRGCLAQLVAYQANRVRDKKILIITALRVLEEYGAFEKLGDPTSLEIKHEETKPHPSTITSNGFYGNQPQQQQQQQQSRAMPSHNKPAASSAHAHIYPIEALSPYSNKWTIKARCTNKSNIINWHNRNGEGKLFNIHLLDESGEIRATGFNDQCDQLYELFQEGAVYYISSPCRVQIAKKQFSNINNDYELTFERDTVVEKAEDQEDVPKVKFNFTTISDLQSVEKDTTIDIIGVLKEVGETNQITSKTTSKPYDKRELTLVDNTGYSVRLTVWGKTASSFDTAPDSVVAFKGVKVSDFGGRSLSLLSSGSMTVNPDMEESHRLKGWYDSQDQNASYSTHANVTSTVAGTTTRNETLKTIGQVKDENLGMTDDADWFTLKATTQYIKQDNFAYPACQEEKCNKKVVEIEPGKWLCERDNKYFEKPQYRYVLSVNVSDHTGQLWLSSFDDVGRQIMGMSADELMEIKEVDDKKCSDIFAQANWKQWVWRCKAKQDTYMEEKRVRYQVNTVKPMNYVTEAQRLADLIKLYNIDE